MRQILLRAAVLCALTCAFAFVSHAQQSPAPREAAPQTSSAPEPKLSGGLYGLEEMREQLREQREQIDELRAALKEQTRLIGELRSRVERNEMLATQTPNATQTAGATLRDATYKADASGPGP